MDLRRLRAGEWITAISGAVLVVSLFLPWYRAGDDDVTAFEAYALVDLLLLLTGVLAVALLVVTATQKTAAVGVASDALLTLFAGIVLVIALIRALNLPGDLEATGADRAAFLWVGLGALLGVLVGSVVAMRDERLSGPGGRTDATGVPMASPPEIEALPAPPRGNGEP